MTVTTTAANFNTAPTPEPPPTYAPPSGFNSAVRDAARGGRVLSFFRSVREFFIGDSSAEICERYDVDHERLTSLVADIAAACNRPTGFCADCERVRELTPSWRCLKCKSAAITPNSATLSPFNRLQLAPASDANMTSPP